MISQESLYGAKTISLDMLRDHVASCYRHLEWTMAITRSTIHVAKTITAKD